MGLFSDWITGTDNPNRNYDANSPMTDAIRRSWQAGDLRLRIMLAAREYCKSKSATLPYPIKLGGEVDRLGDADFVRNFFRDLVDNPMSSFTGSFSGGTATFNAIDCRSCTASVSVYAINYSSTESATRLPKSLGGYEGLGPMEIQITGGGLISMPMIVIEPFSSFLGNNPNGVGGAGNTITQTYEWTEDYNF